MTQPPEPTSAPEPAPQPYLALDIGGTQLAAAAVDHGGRVVRSARVPMPNSLARTRVDVESDDVAVQSPGDDPEVVWAALVGVITRIVEDLATDSHYAINAENTHHAGVSPFAAIGVGCAGPMSWPSGVVSPLAIPAWRDFPLGQRLQALYENTPTLMVRVHNNGACLAIGEHWRGAGKGRDTMLGVAISSGIGGGIITNGKLLTGRTGNAGHIGHIVFDPDGPPCRCGGNGCLETFAAAPPLLAWAQEAGWHPGESVSARELVDDATREHPIALEAIQRAGHALGTVIASLTATLDLDTVIVGGGLAQAGPLLFDPLEQAVREHAHLPFARDVQVVPAALGQDATLVGAAALVISGARYWHASE